MKKTVFITGALTGIGRATAIAFAREGASIALSGRRADAGHTLVSQIHALGADVEFFQMDVRNDDEVRSAVEGALTRFGRIDVAVNSAGTEGHVAPVTEQTPQTYAETFDTNVLGTLLSMKYELLAMKDSGSGSVINISSTMGHRGAPNASLYTASKHAVEGLTKSAALEAAAYGVRVNAIAPGPVQTALLDRFSGSEERKAAMTQGIPFKRLGRPEEIAEAAVFLGSDGASFITGQIIDVNGGKTAL